MGCHSVSTGKHLTTFGGVVTNTDVTHYEIIGNVSSETPVTNLQSKTPPFAQNRVLICMAVQASAAKSLVFFGFMNLVCRHLFLQIGMSLVLYLNRATEHQSILRNKIYFSSRIGTDNPTFRVANILNPAATEIGNRQKAAKLYTPVCAFVYVCV